MKAHRLVASLVALGLAATAAPATALVIDSFLDPFPPHPLLPVSMRRILFVGLQCDGEACPPGQNVLRHTFGDVAEQFELPGVHGGYRFTQLPQGPSDGASTVPYQAQVTIDPLAGGTLRLSASGGGQSTLELWYRFPAVDLLALGVDRFEVEFTEVPANGLVVFLFVESGTPPQNSAGIHVAEMSASGVASFSLADFIPVTGPLDWGAVRFLMVGVEGRTAEPFAMGEVRAIGSPTPADPTTWGRLKSAYR